MTNAANFLWFFAFIGLLLGVIGLIVENRKTPFIVAAALSVVMALSATILYFADTGNRAAELNRKQTTCTSQGYLWTQTEQCFNRDGYLVVIP